MASNKKWLRPLMLGASLLALCLHTLGMCPPAALPLT